MKNFIKKISGLWAQKTSQKGKPFYFTHVPKTAGTSFIVLLDRFFEQAQIFPHQLWREVGHIDRHKNQSYQLFRGHFGGGGVDALCDQPVQHLTLLRDPFALSISTYQFVKRERNTVVHDLVNDEQFDLESFLTHERTAQLVNNRMVRNLSFDFVHDPSAQEVFLSPETIACLQPLVDQSKPALTPEQRFERAKQFIDNTAWFGLVEDFDRSMDLLCHVLKKPAMGVSQKLNVKKDPVEVTEKAHRRLEILNAWDLKLYQHAKSVFEKRYQDMQHDLESFRSHSSQDQAELLDKQYQQAQKRPNEHQAIVSFDQAITGNQWHRRELMEPEKEFFRWTGPGAHASIDLWVKPTDGMLIMRIINACEASVFDQMKLTVNGKPVEWHSEDTGVVRIIKAPIEAPQIKPNGLLRLGIELTKTISHAQAFGSDDERLVGVAVHWIKFNV